MRGGGAASDGAEDRHRERPRTCRLDERCDPTLEFVTSIEAEFDRWPEQVLAVHPVRRVLQAAFHADEARLLQLVECPLDAGVLCGAGDSRHLAAGHAGIGPGEHSECVCLGGTEECGEWFHELHAGLRKQCTDFESIWGGFVYTARSPPAVREHLSCTVGCGRG